MALAEQTKALILEKVGQKSYGLIAREFGVTRSVVAGVVFRERHKNETTPRAPRLRSGPGAFAEQCVRENNHLVARVSFAADEELDAELSRVSADNRMSKSSLIRAAISHYLASLKEPRVPA